MLKMRKSSSFGYLLIMLVSITIMSCKPAPPIKKKRVIQFPKTNLDISNFIPLPLKTTATYKGFALDKFTVIKTSGKKKHYSDVANYLAEKINLKTKLSIPVNVDTSDAIESVIWINHTDTSMFEDPESYELVIAKDTIFVNSNTEVGAFRGIQTLRQLIPFESNDTLADNAIWVIPSGSVFDAPQFAHRGTMLDVARHFFSVEDIKKYIDVLSYYKINVLHLHLSDDQGWRIEIKSWPKLTEIGGSTEVGGESGGFFTQEDYTEIVEYAAARHMMVIPEIDMPGHTNAASVSYPILNGNGKKLKLYEGTRVGFSTFDTRKDTVYAFLDSVIREIASLTPGPYFHIGGDESHVTEKEDYLYFINRVDKIVRKYDKQLIGWDEVANADIDSNSVAQAWNHQDNALTAASKGMKVILSPAKKAYLDMQYDSTSKHGLHWAAYVPTDTAYNWSPETYYLDQKHVLGIEAPLWSETISNIDELEYLAFPRIIGYAELGWTIPENRNWDDYKARLANQTAFLNQMSVQYYPSPLINWVVVSEATK